MRVSPVLEVRDLHVRYRVPGTRGSLHAVDSVSFEIERGETFGLIGESGSGKSTVARSIVGLAPITSGAVIHNGARLDTMRRRRRRASRQSIQMVFQDPHDALDPRMTIRQTIAEPLLIARRYPRGDVDDRVRDLITRVGLDEDHLDRKPHALSGGQKQRANIARALALDPELLICDEALSALDVSVQAGILNLLLSIQQELGIAMLFISHDLAVVAHIADRIGVMYLGRMVVVGSTELLVTRPRHPYTDALLSSEPQALPSTHRRRRRDLLQGDAPSAINPPPGCAFHTRCPHATERCVVEAPVRRPVDDTLTACHHADDLVLGGRATLTGEGR